MIKVILFLKRRPDLSMEAFRDHYESSHVPLSFAHLPHLRKHVRNYVFRRGTDEGPDFDCMTECWFDDWEALKETSKLLTGEKRALIQADEEKFLDRSAIRRVIVEEHVSTRGE